MSKIWTVVTGSFRCDYDVWNYSCFAHAKARFMKTVERRITDIPKDKSYDAVRIALLQSIRLGDVSAIKQVIENTQVINFYVDIIENEVDEALL
jgi:hypothetical protein